VRMGRDFRGRAVRRFVETVGSRRELVERGRFFRGGRGGGRGEGGSDGDVEFGLLDQLALVLFLHHLLCRKTDRLPVPPIQLVLPQSVVHALHPLERIQSDPYSDV